MSISADELGATVSRTHRSKKFLSVVPWFKIDTLIARMIPTAHYAEL
jgi:hypothetical protein